jgi:hypothetical protein
MIEEVDIQVEKKRYLAFRRKTIIQISIIIFCALVWTYFWIFLKGSPFKEEESFLGLMITGFWFIFTPAGLGPVIGGCLISWFLNRWEKFHFRCPSPECDEAIYLTDDWVCPVDKQVTKGLWTLWYTIFTGCRLHKHLSPAHKCPNCGYVFKLVENARTGLNKFSYRPDPAPVQPVQTSQPPRQELMPRDDRFFRVVYDIARSGQISAYQ